MQLPHIISSARIILCDHPSTLITKMFLAVKDLFFFYHISLQSDVCQQILACSRPLNSQGLYYLLAVYKFYCHPPLQIISSTSC